MPPKRKANETAPSSKKARTDPIIEGQALVSAILANKSTYPIPEDPEEFRERLVFLAEYARSLESGSGVPISKAEASSSKTPEQIKEAGDKLANIIRLGLKKQMGWKPTCKEGRAKWDYDGLCEDSRIFYALFKLDGKKKKLTMTPEDFENCIGRIGASVRYSNLRLTGKKVNVSYDPETGAFKLSGTYGI